MYQGQYFDAETDLAYNRFRYYSPNEGIYISQDPIGLAGGNPTLYGYVHDTNGWLDVLGLWTYYQLKNKCGEVVYHGITDRNIQERLLEHARDGKVFNEVSYIDGLETRIDARNIEGSALHNAKGNPKIKNAVRLDGGFYHSYDPNNISTKRTYLSDTEISEIMKKSETVKVNSKGKIKCP